MEITEAIPKKTEELSKGMQQKIQFIAALLHEPDLIIMDEPFSGLDPVNAALLMDTLVDLRKQGKTILFSTHRMDQVEKHLRRHRPHLPRPSRSLRRHARGQDPATRATASRSPSRETTPSSTTPAIESAKNYGGHAEIKLRGSQRRQPRRPATARRRPSQHGTRITRFEVMEPTLEEIFIETVGERRLRRGREARRCITSGSSQSASTSSASAPKAFIIMTILIPLLMGGLVFGARSSANGRSSSDLAHRRRHCRTRQLGLDLKSELESAKQAQPSIDRRRHLAPGLRHPRPPSTSELNARATSTATSGSPRPPLRTPAPPSNGSPSSKADIATAGTAHAAPSAPSSLAKARPHGHGRRRSRLPAQARRSRHAAATTPTRAFASVYALFFLMYFVILFYGMNVARSIIEEKTSRIFEVLLATIRPEEMMAGKVLGVGSVGLTQIGIWIVAGAHRHAASASLRTGGDIHVSITPAQVVFFILFFLLGYILYSSVAAALGAMTSSEQELQQMNMFLMLPLIACSLVILPRRHRPRRHSSRTAFSFFPFCTPLIMYVRIAVGQPPAWQIALSIVAHRPHHLRHPLVRQPHLPRRHPDVRQATQPARDPPLAQIQLAHNRTCYKLVDCSVAHFCRLLPPPQTPCRADDRLSQSCTQRSRARCIRSCRISC